MNAHYIHESRAITEDVTQGNYDFIFQLVVKQSRAQLLFTSHKNHKPTNM